jgi:ribosomal protein L12E/L44/L45/RPP1/RPP2
VGSLALSTDQTDLFVMSVNTIADQFTETFSKYAVPRLLALNGMESNGVKLTHSPAGDVNIMALADFLQKIGALVTWTAADEAWLRQTAKLPDVDPVEIEMERERKQEIAMAIAQRTPAQQGDEQDTEQDDTEDEDTDEGDGAKMRADLFASGPPNNTQRRYFEGRYRTALRGLFAGMQKRVVKGVKANGA